MKRAAADEPMLENYPPLLAWFDKIRAEQLWQIERAVGAPSSRARSNHHVDRIEGWRVRDTFIVAIIHSHKRGWNIFTGPDSNSITKTFAEIERRIGITQ